MLANKIVAHFQDGRLVKGTTSDFAPNKELFHLALVDAAPGTKPVEVHISELKAVFFVKDFAGNPEHKEQLEFDPSQRVMGRKMRVRFKDGEEMVGTTQGYQPSRPGFFMVPVDAETNNERCFVVSSFTTEVTFI